MACELALAFDIAMEWPNNIRSSFGVGIADKSTNVLEWWLLIWFLSGVLSAQFEGLRSLHP